jgi:hypothetical protein
MPLVCIPTRTSFPGPRDRDKTFPLPHGVAVAVPGTPPPPKSQYQVYLAESNHAHLGKLEALAVLKTNRDGSCIAQGIGPLRTLAHAASRV